jgi:8-oxo-dGTP diphosphatase
MTVSKVIHPDVRREGSADRQITEVAVGILISPTDDSFLLTSRPAGKPYAGYWEFPGGKLEAGETVFQALKRELLEEIAIEVQSASVWKTEIFDYPHALVRLNFCKVLQWSGNICMQENQEFIWSQLPVEVTPVLPGTYPVLDWLAIERGFTQAVVCPPRY